MTVPSPGTWELTPTLNGRPCTAATVHADHGPLGARDMTIAPSSISAVCGQSHTLTVVPLEAGRCVAGDEHVTAVLTGPSGVERLGVRLLEGRAGFAVHVDWRAAGRCTLDVYVDGAPVQGSPVVVDAAAGALVPAACIVQDVQLARGVLSLVVRGRDALHNGCAIGEACGVALVATPKDCLEQSTVHRLEDAVRLTAAVRGPGRFNVLVNGHMLLAVDRPLSTADEAACGASLRLLHDDAPVIIKAGTPCSVGIMLDHGGAQVPTAVLVGAAGEEPVTVHARGRGQFEAELHATTVRRVRHMVSIMDLFHTGWSSYAAGVFGRQPRHRGGIGGARRGGASQPRAHRGHVQRAGRRRHALSRLAALPRCPRQRGRLPPCPDAACQRARTCQRVGG